MSGAAHGVNELEATGAITPSLLAKYHLPRVFLDRGPLVISHILGVLATSVPGFAGIPCTEAKRQVVAALESCRSSEVEHGGGLNGNVILRKLDGEGGMLGYEKKCPVSAGLDDKRTKSLNRQIIVVQADQFLIYHCHTGRLILALAK